jgi:hypothetical protein
MSIDPELQAQVDAQLLEQGAFAPLEMLIESGRLGGDDYERWRRGEIDFLDDVLMGDKNRIKEQIDAASGYARRIGLIEQPQEFHAWGATAREGHAALRISADPNWHRLMASRYVRLTDAPQMDLFFDNPVVALTNGLVAALCARSADAARLLDRLYAQAPNHPDLADFDKLLSTLTHFTRPIDDPRRELEFLREVTPVAKRLLGFQARDILNPLWRRLADALVDLPFAPQEPELHRSFALTQAQDWTNAGASIAAEPGWWLHTALCLRLATSAFHSHDRTLALTAWFHLCWRAPVDAANALDRHPAGITALWQCYLAAVESLPAGSAAAEYAMTAADFPAWVLLREPGLTHQFTEPPRGDSAAERHFRCVHAWLLARRDNRDSEEMELRKTLKAANPALFHFLKLSV